MDVIIHTMLLILNSKVFNFKVGSQNYSKELDHRNGKKWTSLKLLKQKIYLLQVEKERDKRILKMPPLMKTISLTYLLI